MGGILADVLLEAWLKEMKDKTTFFKVVRCQQPAAQLDASQGQHFGLE